MENRVESLIDCLLFLCYIEKQEDYYALYISQRSGAGYGSGKWYL